MLFCPHWILIGKRIVCVGLMAVLSARLPIAGLNRADMIASGVAAALALLPAGAWYLLGPPTLLPAGAPGVDAGGVGGRHHRRHRRVFGVAPVGATCQRLHSTAWRGAPRTVRGLGW